MLNNIFGSRDNAHSRGYEVLRHDITFDGGHIYGELYVPTSAQDPLPLVICSHYLGGTHRASGEWAALMAQAGYVGYAFDFRGGSVG